MKNHPSQWIASGLICRHLVDRTTEYLDECLPLLTKVRVGLHVASCADCRTYVRQIALIRETITRLPKQLPSPINRFRLRRHFATHHAQ